MENLDFEKYSTEKLRDMLLQFVGKLTDSECGEVLAELKKP